MNNRFRMFIPDLSFNDSFENGYKNPFVSQLLIVQKETSPDIFDMYPKPVKQYIVSSEMKLRKEYKKNEISNMIREKYLSEVTAVLHSKNIDSVPLKGVWLLHTLFKDYTGLRKMSDIDILVKKKDFASSGNCLASIGTVQGLFNKKRCYSSLSHEFSLLYKSAVVEIHRGQSALDLFAVHYEDFFENGTTITDRYGTRLFVPSVEMMTLFYLFHDVSDGIHGFQPMTYEKMARMLLLIKSCDYDNLLSLLNKYKIKHMLSLYEEIFSVVFRSYKKTGNSLFIPTGQPHAPLRFQYGEYMFKLLVFRRESIKKVVPKMFCAPIDAMYNLITRKFS